MPNLVHIASLWSLRGHPSSGREWSLERKIKAVAAANFDGIMTALVPEHRRLADRIGLRHLIGFISSANPDEFAELIKVQKENGATQINVQLDDHDTPPAVATKHWIKMVRAAEKIGGVVVSLENHRDCCTETPEKTYEIAERYYRITGEIIKLTLDFSHFAVVKQLAPANYAQRLLRHRELVQNAAQVHLRPFNGNHCQVPVIYRGRLTAEAISYLAFVDELMKVWRDTPKNLNGTFFACPEMGPYGDHGAGYNITGLPPAWPEAAALRIQISKAWKRSGQS